MTKVLEKGTQDTSLVFNLHDKDGSQIALLLKLKTVLKEYYNRAFISVTPLTEANKELVKKLDNEPFFVLNFNEPESLVYDHYTSGYRNAVNHSKPDQVLHLLDLDRLAFALLTNHRKNFLADTISVGVADTPLSYMRSEIAWNSHPKNYHSIEAMVTRMGEILFGKALDYTWCHLAITAGDLQKLLSETTDRSLVYPHTEMMFLLRDRVRTKTVDWLSWEDPFILGKDLDQLKKEREGDSLESEKRMRTALQEIKFLLEKFRADRRFF